MSSADALCVRANPDRTQPIVLLIPRHMAAVAADQVLVKVGGNTDARRIADALEGAIRARVSSGADSEPAPLEAPADLRKALARDVARCLVRIGGPWHGWLGIDRVALEVFGAEIGGELLRGVLAAASPTQREASGPSLQKDAVMQARLIAGSFTRTIDSAVRRG